MVGIKESDSNDFTRSKFNSSCGLQRDGFLCGEISNGLLLQGGTHQEFVKMLVSQFPTFQDLESKVHPMRVRLKSQQDLSRSRGTVDAKIHDQNPMTKI